MNVKTEEPREIQPVVHLTVKERARRGREARTTAPRSAQAALELQQDRDPIAILEAQGANRVAELLPIRYGRMLASPFAFYRGAALLMATDLAPAAVTGLTVQACGDAHLSNFGVFASPERNLIFDINDFDETLPAPWEWDVKRLTASIEVAGRTGGASLRHREDAVRAAVRSYREHLGECAEMPSLEVWYERI